VTEHHPASEFESAVVRIAGDSGDGVQLVGGRLSLANALAGNDLVTFPDYPAEIRAPAGSIYGVSAYQIHFGGRAIKTIGDKVDVLLVFNAAALKANLRRVRSRGLVIVDTSGFVPANLAKAGYATSPLDDGSLKDYRVLAFDIGKLTIEATAPMGLGKKASLRCKNFYALGLLLWLFGRERARTAMWLEQKFLKTPIVAAANIAAMNAGHALGETIEASGDVARIHVPAHHAAPGTYRAITGAEAMAFGLAAAAELSGRQLVFCSYPITPASEILHYLSELKDLGVVTFQAEDEIAGAGAALGASYAGALGATATSGPGMALKTEVIGLAVALELPLVIVNAQRAGPSTGLPTKTEQSDLYQAVFGRNGDAPLPVIACRSPADSFGCAIEAARLAQKYMTPVILLTDGFINNTAEPWKLPRLADLPEIAVPSRTDPTGFLAFHRDETTLARPWAAAGTPGLAHRIGGLERDSETGMVSYDPANHHKMSKLRAAKIARIAADVPALPVDQGEPTGDLAVVGWGSTFGPISRAVGNLREQGHSVSHIHLRHLFPFPANQRQLMLGFRRILVPEMNMGQLVTLMRAQGCPVATGLAKVEGQPFTVAEIEAAALEALRGLHNG
jgi:2-oxoglutarate ferredoxin oxidoreductase subunit alpha